MFYHEILGICLNSIALAHRFYFHFDFCNIYHGARFACELIGFSCSLITFIQYLHPRPMKLEGGYTGFTLSVHPSVCRRHGFRSISQVSFGFSISNFIYMLMMAKGRSLLIFSDVTSKMAAWWPYWMFWFPDSNFTLALNIDFKLQRHNTYVYG